MGAGRFFAASAAAAASASAARSFSSRSSFARSTAWLLIAASMRSRFLRLLLCVEVSPSGAPSETFPDPSSSSEDSSSDSPPRSILAARSACPASRA